MINVDLINGLFESAGGVLCWLNVRRILRERQVRGVSWSVTAFFATWGVWNLFYYPSLGQWCSFAGGILLVLGNATWVALAIHFERAERRKSTVERNEKDLELASVEMPEWRERSYEKKITES